MPNLKDIQRRIGTVQKTQKITRAMRMVAGAKLRRAQQASEAARPYADRMRATLDEVARSQSDFAHPLLEVRESVRRVEVVAVTSNRGLCGAFNSNLQKHAEALVSAREREGAEVWISTAGRKARDHFRRRRAGQLQGDYPQDGWVQYEQAAEIARDVAARFLAGETDEVVLTWNAFVSTMTQRPTQVRLLPMAAEPPGTSEPETADATDEDAAPYEIEPNAESLLAVLVPKAVEVQVYQALLENQTGEHAARMAAMESATRNTEELVESLTLQFNRARQAAITKELVEIVSGAEAL